jgi:hypothetical protein
MKLRIFTLSLIGLVAGLIPAAVNAETISRLLGVAFGGATPEQQSQLELIRLSTGTNRPGDGLVDLTRALLNSPMEPPPEAGVQMP